MLGSLVILLSVAGVTFGGVTVSVNEMEAFKSRYRRQTGSARLGDPCYQNIDCINYLNYCENGVCACTADSVNVNGICQMKIMPGSSGCSTTIQCTSAWPDTTCVGGTCQCPTGYFAAQTRDGGVCVANSVTDFGPIYNCPTPDYTGSQDFFSIQGFGYVNAIPSLWDGLEQARTCTSGGTCTYNTASNTASLYDCIATDPGATLGICCPNRAFTCTMQLQTGGATNGVQRYYYNSASGTCQTFTYNTFGADETNTNANNFKTLEQCRTYCMSGCPRGVPQYTANTGSFTGTGNIATCTSLSGTCGTNYECTEVGESYLCCATSDYICSGSGGIGPLTAASTAGNPGFSASLVGTGTSRWFYNTVSGTCQTFNYLGAGGNFNNFATQQECTEFCAQAVCTYGTPLLTPTGATQSCNSDADCPESYMCSSSASTVTFANICCPRTQALCEGTKVIGTCQNFVTRYWYNPNTRECENFLYSGCGGNQNNFRTQTECLNACGSSTGPAMTCPQGIAYRDGNGDYTVCSTNSNTGFPTTFNSCPTNYDCYYDGFRYGCCPVKSYTCSLSYDSGRNCNNQVSRYYFDTTSGQCSTFVYLGCDGNSNNFLTREQCENYCGSQGCPSGGTPYLEPSTSARRTCSASVTCPTGYECLPVLEGAQSYSRCCPTIAFVCQQPPVTSTCSNPFSGLSVTSRYYYNQATQSCQNISISSLCVTGGNDFPTLTSCQTFCRSAACMAGEIAFVDSTNTARTCNSALTSSSQCPSGYTCRFDSLTGGSYCCGSTNAGVCLTTQKAFMDARTAEPRECLPSNLNSCPSPYACQYSQTLYKYYCCAPLDAAGYCPEGFAPYYTTNAAPISCTISAFSPQSNCPVGFTCQSASNTLNTFSGYCCSQYRACPTGATYQTTTNGNPVTCSLGTTGFCASGYSCQSTAGTINTGVSTGYCCSGGELGGCPAANTYFWYSTLTDTTTCTPFGTNTGCTSPSSCQFSTVNNKYQCCSSTQQNTGPVTCGVGQISFNGQCLQTVNAGGSCLVSEQCLGGSFCSGSPLLCNCPTGATNTGGICTGSGPASCTGGQIAYNNLCYSPSYPNEACTIGVVNQCLGGSSCQSGVCRCPAGMSIINRACSTAVVTQPPVITQPPVTTAPLTGYCPNGESVQTSGGLPVSCLASSFSCTAPYVNCRYSSTRRNYYCCGIAGTSGTGGTSNLGSNGCPSPYTQTIEFPGFGPVECNLTGTKSCTTGYTCVQGSRGFMQCCR